MLPNGHIILGIIVGAATATTLSFINPGWVSEAIASEFAPHTFDVSKLVKFDDKAYSMTIGDSVDIEPQSVTTVRKIGLGRISYVDIYTTETGIYSNEALFSRNVRYPGIDVKLSRPHGWSWGAVSGWGYGGWVSLPLVNANSIIIVQSWRPQQGQPGPLGTCMVENPADFCL
jgi:hypothetical protein